MLHPDGAVRDDAVLSAIVSTKTCGTGTAFGGRVEWMRLRAASSFGHTDVPSLMITSGSICVILLRPQSLLTTRGNETSASGKPG